MGKHTDWYSDTQDNSCTKFCTRSRIKYITLTTILVVLGLGAGFGIGYVVKKDKITSSHPSEDGQTTSPSSSRPSFATTTQPIPLRACPPTLPQTTTSNVLLSLDETITLTNFNKYSIEYTSPTNVATAMLMFEFDTVWGSWYLDDVSVKESGNTNRELIDNGGFETGNLGSKWSFCDPRYPWIMDGTVVDHTFHSGKYSYESKDPGVGSQEYLTQIFNIKSNTRYRIEFYIFYSGEPSSAKVTIISH